MIATLPLVPSRVAPALRITDSWYGRRVFGNQNFGNKKVRNRFVSSIYLICAMRCRLDPTITVRDVHKKKARLYSLPPRITLSSSQCGLPTFLFHLSFKHVQLFSQIRDRLLLFLHRLLLLLNCLCQHRHDVHRT